MAQRRPQQHGVGHSVANAGRLPEQPGARRGRDLVLWSAEPRMRTSRGPAHRFFPRNEDTSHTSEVQPRVSGDATPQDARSETSAAHP